MSTIASLFVPGKLLENNIHMKSLINTYVLLHIYVIMYVTLCHVLYTLQWRHNGRDGV